MDEKDSNAASSADWKSDKSETKSLSREILNQTLSGFTVAMAMIPEAVAFALVAKVQPEVGLHAAWIMCLVCGLLGGRSGMISGATGSTAVMMGPVVASHGVGTLFYAVMLSGIFELFFGVLRIHNTLKYVTLPVKIGFLNALAIVIFEAQKHSFYEPVDHSVEETEMAHQFVEGTPLYLMLGLAFVALIINLLPFEKLQKLPLALISIAICTGLEWGLIRLKYWTILVKDVADLSSGFPNIIFFRKSSFEQFDDKARTVLPALDEWGTWKEILPLAFFLAMIGIAETLMTLEAIDAELRDDTDEKTNDSTKKGCLSPIKNLLLNNPKLPAAAQTEVLAQGIGNILSGLFGSMGGCAMIGQSMINVHNGGDKRLSSVIAGFFTLLVILTLSPIIGIIPLGSLVGVMFCVSYHTFEWSSLGWMLNSIFGGGRTFFGLLKSDGCMSKFFYGGEEECASNSENESTSENLESTDDGEPSYCEVTTDEEVVITGVKPRGQEVGVETSKGSPEIIELKPRGAEVGVEGSEYSSRTSNGSRAGASKLDKVDSVTSSTEHGTKSQVSEISSESEEERLSDLNIMDTLVIVLTMVLTMKTNLAIAVLAGAFASNVERYIYDKFLSSRVCAETEDCNTGMV